MTAEQVHALGFHLTGERDKPPFCFPCAGCGVRPCKADNYYDCFGMHGGVWFRHYKPNAAYKELFNRVIDIREPATEKTEAGVQYLLFEV